MSNAVSPSGGEASPSPPTRLTFASGGWVVALAILLIAGILTWAFAGVFSGHHPLGDGRTVESYGFDLSKLTVPAGALSPSGHPRDFLTPLDDPTTMRGLDMVEYNAREHRVYVATTDRVLGVVVNGEARAYPLHILNAHEICNDTLAGVKIAVTYSPLCDSALVFDRVIAGKERRFGVSGLLLQSNLVMYDQGPEHPGLWSQLGMRAISGELAGTAFQPLPGVAITTWMEWLASHPSTSVILPDESQRKKYADISYSRYFLAKRLDAPVDPQPSPESLAQDGLHLKSPMVAIRAGDGSWSVIAVSQLIRAAGLAGRAEIMVDGIPCVAAAQAEPSSAALIVPRQSSELVTVPCLWFAWYAFHPEARPAPLQLPSQSVK